MRLYTLQQPNFLIMYFNNRQQILFDITHERVSEILKISMSLFHAN